MSLIVLKTSFTIIASGTDCRSKLTQIFSTIGLIQSTITVQRINNFCTIQLALVLHKGSHNSELYLYGSSFY